MIMTIFGGRFSDNVESAASVKSAGRNTSHAKAAKMTRRLHPRPVNNFIRMRTGIQFTLPI
jgi:hypothetical protein